MERKWRGGGGEKLGNGEVRGNGVEGVEMKGRSGWLYIETERTWSGRGRRT